MAIHSIAVFCGSKSGLNPIFATHAAALGQLFAEKKVAVIYGGGSKGLMGAIADATLKHKGNVTGIIPKILCDLEQQHRGLSELTIVDNMHIRKQLLYDKCDAAIILPGGYGTMDEVFEMLTWNQLNIHNKKIFFMNSGGFYDNLVAHIHMMQEEDFLYGHPDEKITVLQKPEEMVKYLI